jgi:hypothetical protein
MATKTKIAATVGMLAEAFGRKLTAAQLKAYEIGLDGVDDDELNRATVVALQQNRQHPPSPGELRAIATGTSTSDSEHRALMAWVEFDKATMKYGGDYSVSFEDGLINATVRICGGWVWCCERQGDDYSVWLKKAFMDTYKGLIGREVATELRMGFTGRIAMANAGIPRDANGKPVFSGGAYVGQMVDVRSQQPVLLPSYKPEQQAALPAPLEEARRAMVASLDLNGEP